MLQTQPQSLADPANETDVLAGLLAFSQSRASAVTLLQHFPSIGHVLSADASQLHAFGLTGRDVALFRLVREGGSRRWHSCYFLQ